VSQESTLVQTGPFLPDEACFSAASSISFMRTRDKGPPIRACSPKRRGFHLPLVTFLHEKRGN
jgi:hypothetical protein